MKARGLCRVPAGESLWPRAGWRYSGGMLSSTWRQELAKPSRVESSRVRSCGSKEEGRRGKPNK